MTFWLRNTNIRAKLIILALSIFTPLCLLQFFELANSRTTMYEDRKKAVKQVVETAYGIISYWGEQSSTGKVSKLEAQKNVIDQIKDLRYDENQYFWINDNRPFMIMHPFSPQLDGTDISNKSDPNGIQIFVEMVNTVKKNNEGYVDYSWPKPGASTPKEKTSFVKLYEPWGWIIGSGIYIDDIEEIFWQKVWEYLILLSLNILLISFLTYKISSIIYKATENLRQSLEQVAQHKDLTHRTDVIDKDELGQTGIAVNYMLSSFQNGISTVSNAVNQLASSSTQLKTDAQSTNNDIETQHREIELVASAIEEMSATTRDVSRNIQTTALATQDANDQSTEGLSTANEARKTILTLANEVETVSLVVKDIEEDSNNISAILDVIRGISEQTNLLALNAAIEAARAGEHGRGFAVVADEVRSLSQRTQDSVSDIEEKVRRFQEGSQNAVKAMTTGTEQANESVNKITKVAETLSQINESIQNINSSSLQIATAAEEQSAVANEISQNIVKINNLSESTSQRSTQGYKACEALYNLSLNLKSVTDEFNY